MGEPRDELFGNPLRGIGMRRLEREGAGEFVAAEARDQGAVRHRSENLVSDMAQQGIADGMAVHVVHGLEVVEIDHQKRQRLARAVRLGEGVRAVFREGAAIEKAGQRIASGELLGALLGCCSNQNLAGKRAMAAPADQDQRDVEQQRDDEGAIGNLAAGQIVLGDAGQYRAAGADEQEGGGDGDRAGDEIDPARRGRIVDQNRGSQAICPCKTVPRSFSHAASVEEVKGRALALMHRIG